MLNSNCHKKLTSFVSLERVCHFRPGLSYTFHVFGVNIDSHLEFWDYHICEYAFKTHIWSNYRAKVVCPESMSQSSYRFDILHRRRQYHCRALCKILKWLGKWNWWYRRQSLECKICFVGISYITNNSPYIMRSLAIRSLGTAMGSFLHQPRGNADNHGREVIPFTLSTLVLLTDFTKSCVRHFVWRHSGSQKVFKICNHHCAC